MVGTNKVEARQKKREMLSVIAFGPGVRPGPGSQYSVQCLQAAVHGLGIGAPDGPGSLAGRLGGGFQTVPGPGVRDHLVRVSGPVNSDSEQLELSGRRPGAAGAASRPGGKLNSLLNSKPRTRAFKTVQA